MFHLNFKNHPCDILLFLKNINTLKNNILEKYSQTTKNFFPITGNAGYFINHIFIKSKGKNIK